MTGLYWVGSWRFVGKEGWEMESPCRLSFVSVYAQPGAWTAPLKVAMPQSVVNVSDLFCMESERRSRRRGSKGQGKANGKCCHDGDWLNSLARALIYRFSTTVTSSLKHRGLPMHRTTGQSIL